MCCDFGDDDRLDLLVVRDEVSADGELVALHPDAVLVVLAPVVGDTKSGVETIRE